jgi:hypothetical protein
LGKPKHSMRKTNGHVKDSFFGGDHVKRLFRGTMFHRAVGVAA